MVLIFGGVYQGKLDYAKEHYGGTVFDCRGTTLNFEAKIINGLENFVRACVAEGMEAADYLAENRQKLADKVIICRDISQGIVPMEKEERAWREMTGRAMLYLGKEAEEVIRIFCGLAQQVK
ncbi:MAG: bifunctional adenosylcobinamide kinase/adenosylcobinamide-phosphate guanylyltransferase [Anaerovoracaceae bacterium]